MSNQMTPALENLLDAIRANYKEWSDAGNRDNDERKRQIRADMIERFNNSLSYKEGKKYIKIIKDGSVWGFVVNTQEDAKFRYGDILKAASWATPTRNAARGNVFEELNNIQWTGASYL